MDIESMKDMKLANDNPPGEIGMEWMRGYDKAKAKMKDTYGVDLSGDELSELSEELDGYAAGNPPPDAKFRLEDALGRFFNRLVAYDANEFLMQRGYVFEAGLIAAKLKDSSRLLNATRKLAEQANRLSGDKDTMRAFLNVTVVLASLGNESNPSEFRGIIESALQKVERQDMFSTEALCIIALKDRLLAQRALTKVWQGILAETEASKRLFPPALMLAKAFADLPISKAIQEKGANADLHGTNPEFIEHPLDPATHMRLGWNPKILPSPFGATEWKRYQRDVLWNIDEQGKREREHRMGAAMSLPLTAGTVFRNGYVLAGTWEKPESSETL